jgi:F0F1-type ATP synthase assembly protein I
MVEKDFAERMAKLREELVAAQAMDDPFLIANIEAQITQLDSGLAEFRETTAAIDEEFADRLSQLESRVDAVKATRDNVQKQKDRQFKADGEAAKGLGVGMAVAYSFIGCPIVGYGIGFLITKSTGNPYAKDWGAIIGIVIGFFAMFVLLKRAES